MPRRLVQETPVSLSMIPTIGGSNIVSAFNFDSGVTGWSGTNASVASEATIKRSGSNSMKVTVTTATGKASYTTGSQTSGKRYYTDFYVIGDATSAGKFVRVKLTANGDASTQDTVKYKLSSTTWTRIRCSIYNNVTGTITVELQGVDLANGYIFYVDDGYMDYVNTPVTTTANRRFYYNGVSTYLSCCNYNNTPTEGAFQKNWAYEEGMLPYDFQDLKDQGCNSIRIYYGNYNANEYGRGFDCAWNYGLSVMVLKYMDLSFNYGDPGNDGTANFSQATGSANRTAHINTAAPLVDSVKTHPAVIAYGDGSETNYKLGTNSLTDWVTLMNLWCAAAKTADSTRVTYTSHGGLPNPSIDSQITSMDLFGYTSYGGNAGQIYRGSTLNGVDVGLATRTSKAVMLTEIGTGCTDATNPATVEAQGNSDVFLLNQARSFYPLYCGDTYFQWSDDQGDSSQYGKTDSVAGGSADYRPKRTSYHIIKQWMLGHPIPGY